MSEPTPLMRDTRITFIGAGNMASALFGGMIAQGWPPTHITATDPSGEMLSAARTQGINTSQDNQHAIADADVVVLAVKPQSQLQELTMAGIFFESREPPTEEFSFADLKTNFAEGQYNIHAVSFDGAGLTGSERQSRA